MRKGGKTTASGVRITGPKHHIPKFSAVKTQTKKSSTGK